MRIYLQKGRLSARDIMKMSYTMELLSKSTQKWWIFPWTKYFLYINRIERKINIFLQCKKCEEVGECKRIEAGSEIIIFFYINPTIKTKRDEFVTLTGNIYKVNKLTISRIWRRVSFSRVKKINKRIYLRD